MVIVLKKLCLEVKEKIILVITSCKSDLCLLVYRNVMMFKIKEKFSVLVLCVG